MRLIFFIVSFFVLQLNGQINSPFTAGTSRLDFNLPDIERGEGAADTIVTKSRASVYTYLNAPSVDDFSEIQIQIGSAKDESQYLNSSHSAPFNFSGTLVSFSDIMLFDRVVGDVWLSIRVRYTNNTFSSKSYIKIN